MIYFTSDLHFDHAKIIEYCKRPFDSVEEMNKTIVENINSVVTDKDTLYILGDICFSKRTTYFLEQINGRKIIIMGNHDNDNDMLEASRKNIIDWRKSYCEFKYYKKRFILFHYPIEFWNKGFYGSIHLHGHSHNSKPLTVKNRIDVGVDAWNYKPVSIDEIMEFVVNNKDVTIDHPEWFKEK